MNLPLHIAGRYLLSKKSHNAINLVSLVSVLGVAAATLALVCTLSAFNGFQGLIGTLYGNFDPDLKISAVQGKSFHTGTQAFDRVRQLPGVAVCCESIEENVLVRYKDSQTSAVLKGVAASFDSLTSIRDCLRAGSFKLNDEGIDFATIGAGLAATLGTGYSFIDPVMIYAPRRKGTVSLINPAASFKAVPILLTGAFAIGQPEYDDQRMIVPLAFARQLLEYSDDEVSCVEIKVARKAELKTVKKQIREILGQGYRVEDLHEQKAEFYRINRMEKWITYLMLCFILIIALFNVIGSLSMLILEKKEDAGILAKLGADGRLIRRVFLYEGWLIALSGAVLGIVLGAALCLLQQRYGWLKLGDGNFIVSAYPVALKPGDLLLVLVTVLTVSLPSVWWPVHYIFSGNEPSES